MDACGERRRLEGELSKILVELGELREQMTDVPAGLIGRFRRRIARQAAGLERRLSDVRARWAELPPFGD